MNDTTSALVFRWKVTKVLWWWNYQVFIQEMELQITAYPSWKMKKNNIKIIEWDSVQVELNEYEPTKWRILYRFK